MDSSVNALAGHMPIAPRHLPIAVATHNAGCGTQRAALEPLARVATRHQSPHAMVLGTSEEPGACRRLDSGLLGIAALGGAAVGGTAMWMAEPAAGAAAGAPSP